MPDRLCEEQLMEQPVRQPCYCDVRLCGKKKRMPCVNILKIEIYHMDFSKVSRHHIVNWIVQSAPKRLCIFSNFFDSQHVGAHIFNEWTGVAMLCCHGKSSSYIPTSKVIGSFQLWVHIIKIL